MAFGAVLASPVAALEASQAEAIDRIVASVPAGKSAEAVLARHYAVLLWVEDYCNGRSQESVRAYLMKKGETNRDAFEEAWAEASAMLVKTDPKAMCALALEQYGPEGALIRGAWAPKS